MPAPNTISHLLPARPGFLFLATLLCLLLYRAPLSQAAIYKWVDEKGQVHYGERPAAGSQSAEQVKIHDITTKPRISKEDLEIDAINRREAEEERKKQEALQPKPVEKKISPAEKRRLCKQARDDYAKISSRGRMREINSKGEYTYLSEKQRQQRLAAAKKRQRKYCY